MGTGKLCHEKTMLGVDGVVENVNYIATCRATCNSKKKREGNKNEDNQLHFWHCPALAIASF